MKAIRITRRLDSDTLHLPELRPLIGRSVEILVQEVQPAGVVAGTGDWEAAARAAEQLRETGYDFDARRLCSGRDAPVASAGRRPTGASSKGK